MTVRNVAQNKPDKKSPDKCPTQCCDHSSIDIVIFLFTSIRQNKWSAQ